MTPDDQDTGLKARRASSFGAAAASYGDHRPDYPDPAIDWVLEPVRSRRTVRVLDLAAGTGLLTQALQRAEVDVIAVEPDPQMRAEMLRRVFGVAVLAGVAEDIPLPDERVDAVVAGQALHWFDQRRALPEIARVLKPGGVFAALWNSDDVRVDWVAEYTRISGYHLPDDEREYHPDVAEHSAFGPLEWATFGHQHSRTVDSLVATASTHSAMLVLEPHERTERLRNIRKYLQSRPETASGAFDMPLVTTVARAIRH